MPLVQINLTKGRSAEQIQAMTTAVANAIAESLPAPIETVRVMVNEMEHHQYSVGGKPWPKVVAERAAAAAAQAEKTEVE